MEANDGTQASEASTSSSFPSVEEELGRLTMVTLLTASTFGVQFSRAERVSKPAMIR